MRVTNTGNKIRKPLTEKNIVEAMITKDKAKAIYDAVSGSKKFQKDVDQMKGALGHIFGSGGTPHSGKPRPRPNPDPKVDKALDGWNPHKPITDDARKALDGMFGGKHKRQDPTFRGAFKPSRRASDTHHQKAAS